MEEPKRQTSKSSTERCRCCLTTSGTKGAKLNSIFISEDPITTWLRECCALSVYQDDGLPSKICKLCLAKLKAFFEFRKLCLTNNDILLLEQIQKSSIHLQVEQMKLEVENQWDAEYMKEEFLSEDLWNLEDCSQDVKQELFRNGEFSNLVYEDIDKEELIVEKETKFNLNSQTTTAVNDTDTTSNNYQNECRTYKYIKERVKNKNLGGKHYCGSCNKHYRSETSHKKVYHAAESDPSKLYSQCHVCGERFRSKQLYGVHLRSKHPAESLTCSCGATFQTVKQLIRHRWKVHTAARYQCEYCSKMFKLKSQLSKHIKKHLDAMRRIEPVKVATAPVVDACTTVCPLCSKNLHSSHHLREHINFHHLGLKYYCEICERHFVSMYKHNLRKHRDLHAGFSKRCYLCNEQLLSKRAYGRHMQEKHGASRGQCECGFRYSTRAALYAHRQRVHEKTLFVCQICSKTFLMSKSLDVHMAVHLSETKYSCSQCPMKVKTRRTLVLHERRHGAARVIPCPHCHLMFRTNSDLKLHMRAHDPANKIHSCALCAKKFGRTDVRNEHERQVHQHDRRTQLRKRGKKMPVEYLPGGVKSLKIEDVGQEASVS